MKRLLVMVALVASACGPLAPPVVDGGAGGGGGSIGGGGGSLGGGGGATGGGGGAVGGGGGTTGGGGGTTGGGGGTTGGGGGSVGGGGGGATGGGGGSTDAGVWEFSSLSLSSTGALSGTIVGLGESGGSTWAMSSRGRLFRLGSTGFTEVLTLTDGTNSLQPTDFEVSPSGRMFAVTTVRFLTCATGCDQAGNWTQVTISANNESLEALCVVDDSHVLALGSRGAANDGVAYRWNGTALGTSATLVGAESPRSCWRGGSGDFFIPARDAVVRYTPGDQSFTPETIATGFWRGGGSALGTEFVTAGGPLIARRSGSSWTTEFTLSVSGQLNVVLGAGPAEAFAFGGGPSTSGQAGYRFRSGAWAAMNPDVPVMNVARSGFQASDGRLYVGGENANNEVCVLRGTLR